MEEFNAGIYVGDLPVTHAVVSLRTTRRIAGAVRSGTLVPETRHRVLVNRTYRLVAADGREGEVVVTGIDTQSHIREQVHFAVLGDFDRPG